MTNRQSNHKSAKNCNCKEAIRQLKNENRELREMLKEANEYISYSLKFVDG